MPVDLNIMVGGEAGQGIQTIGFILGKTLSGSGLHVFADQDYESRIRGGHNFFRVRNWTCSSLWTRRPLTGIKKS
jgi:2-oxoglutarate ferredoxin oxidoreductase subunit alpha